MQEEYGLFLLIQLNLELNKHNIFLIEHTELNEQQREYVKELFNVQIVPHIMPMIILKQKITPFLRNQCLYLAVKLSAGMEGQKRRKDKNRRKQNGINMRL
jgi:polyphosphate kinase